MAFTCAVCGSSVSYIGSSDVAGQHFVELSCGHFNSAVGTTTVALTSADQATLSSVLPPNDEAAIIAS